LQTASGSIKFNLTYNPVLNKAAFGKQVATHELGHVIRLGDIDYSTAIMHWEAGGSASTVTAYDKDSVAYKY
jgi:hypothetical protein